jgi:hypothetical protein
MSLANCDLDEVEIVLGDKFELVNREGKYYAVSKKPKYPKTYEECCDVLGKTKAYQSVSGYKTELLEDFQKLLICRDAYWKIAGDWEEKRKEKAMHYVICSTLLGEVVKDTMPNCIANYLLDFPTEEMRDAFYENFNDLIEECKELL